MRIQLNILNTPGSKNRDYGFRLAWACCVEE